MEKKMSFSTREIAVCAVLLALILVFMLVPIPTGTIDIAIIPLLAVFIACQVEGGKIGIFMAFSFGIASLIAAFLRPTVLSPIFYNPMVSVIPRIMIGITTYFTYVGMRKATSKLLMKKRDKKATKRLSILVSSGVSTAVGIFTNTGLVVAMLALFNFGKAYGGNYVGTEFILGLITINFLIELAIALIATPAIVLALRSALRKPQIEDLKEAHSENELVNDAPSVELDNNDDLAQNMAHDAQSAEKEDKEEI